MAGTGGWRLNGGLSKIHEWRKSFSFCFSERHSTSFGQGSKTLKVDFRYGEAIANIPWTVVFGVVTVRGVDLGALESAVASCERSVASGNSQMPVPAMRRIQAFESFFAENGFRSPLTAQLKAVREKGLPSGSPLVRALLLSETSTGILMGAQDAAAIKGTLVCDLANEGEAFPGMRAEVLCRKGEIVLRDSEGMIAALFQGPDRRTRLTRETRDVLFFVFSVPGVDLADVQEGVDAVRMLFESACSELDAQVYASRTISSLQVGSWQ
jgi:DNA/RNA-binding domain of Phe-tRNA-synthetase-like protein